MTIKFTLKIIENIQQSFEDTMTSYIFKLKNNINIFNTLAVQLQINRLFLSLKMKSRYLQQQQQQQPSFVLKREDKYLPFEREI